MANAIELLLKLKGDVTGLKGVSSSLKTVNKGLKTLKKEADDASNALSDIGREGAQGMKEFATGAAAATAAISAVVYQVNQMNVELRRNATLAGTTIEQFQEWAFLGQSAGVSVEETADALNNLNLKITEWTSLGSGAGGDVLRKLGLDPQNLAEINDSGEQMITFLEKLGKSTQNVQRLFADEFGSDALIFLAQAAKDAGDLQQVFEEFRNTGAVITQEESDQLLAYNVKMAELTALIKKAGAQALISFDTELKGALQSASTALQKLIKDFEDPFGGTAQAIQYLDGTLDTLIGGAKLAKDSLDVLFFSNDENSQSFKRNVAEMGDSMEQFTNGIKQTIYTDFAIAEDEIGKLEKRITDFDVADLVSQGFDENAIRSEWQKLAKEATGSVADMQQAVLRYPPIVQGAMQKLLDEMLNGLRDTNDKVQKDLSETEFKVVGTVDAAATEKNIIDEADKAIKQAQGQIDFIKIQFQAGTIDLEDYKKLTQEQVDIQNEALKKASNEAVGLDQLTYNKRLEQNKIFVKKLESQQAIVDPATQNQIKANEEIALQEIEILKNKGKVIEALKEEEALELKQLERRNDLSEIDKAVQSLNIEELYDFKQAEVEAEAFEKSINGIFSKLETAEGAERISLLGDLDIQLKKLENLSNAYSGLKTDIEDFNSKRDAEGQKGVLTEEQIAEGSRLVLQSKLQVLEAEGKTNEAKSLALQLTIAELNRNENITDEQRKQLAQDAIALKNLEKRNQELAITKSYNEQISSNLLKIYQAEGKVNEAKKLELDLEIQRINALEGYTNAQKDKLAQDAITLKNLEEQKRIEADIAYNADLLQQKENELLQIQGDKEKILKSQYDTTVKNVEANDRLTQATKDQILAIEKQKLAYGQARLEVEQIEQEVAATIARMNEAETSEEYMKLAATIQEPINRLKELEALYPGLTTKSNEFTNAAIQGAENLELSVAQAAEVYSDLFVDSFASVIEGTQTVEDAFKNMLYSIVQELLKSNIQELLTGLFSDGGSLAGGSDLFTSFAGLFSGTALHTGGIAGKDGFARNFTLDASMFTKYHTGGIAGLKPNEVPTVLEKGEEVLTASDPRHVNNGGQTSGQINIINEMNTEETAKELGHTRAMKDAIRNEIRTNPTEYKSYLS